MLKLTLTTAVAIYAAFIIWGKPVPVPAEAPAPEVATLGGASDATFDAPVILSRNGPDATVTRAAVTETVVPDAARIAAEIPAADASAGRRIGDPVSVSLLRPDAEVGDGAGSEAPAEAAASEASGAEGLLRVSGTTVNMRAGPSTAEPVVGNLAEGTLAEPLGPEADGWIEIRDVASGRTGFMSARFLDPA